MNAILGGPTIENTKSTGAGLSSKNYFLSNFCGTTANQTGSSLADSSVGGVYPKLELLINDHVLPSNMTIYQAIKQYASSNIPATSVGTEQSVSIEADAENTSLLNNAIWSKVHLIHYRIAQPSTSEATTSSAAAAVSASISKETDAKRSTRNSNNKQQPLSPSKLSQSLTILKKQGGNKHDESSLDSTDSNAFSVPNTSLDASLTSFFNKLSSSKTKIEQNINDRSIDSILLLRLLSFVNREWLFMYKDVQSLESINSFSNSGSNTLTQMSSFLTGMNEFVNTKLTAKANRQLQDPLVVMTGKE